MRLATSLAVLTIAFSAGAGESLELADGSKITLKKGRIELVEDSQAIWTFKMQKAGPDDKGDLIEHDLAGESTAIHARVDLGKGKASEAVLIRNKNKKKPKVIWNSITGLKGDVGERWSEAVRFEDLTGDGLVEIITGQMSEAVRLCGREELPLLCRKVYNLKRKAFQSILAKRPGLKTPVEITGTFDPGNGPIQPLVKQASTCLTYNHNYAML